MGIIDRAKALIGGDDAFRYQCTSCGAVFDSEEAHMGKVTCPECGDRSVRDYV